MTLMYYRFKIVLSFLNQMKMAVFFFLFFLEYKNVVLELVFNICSVKHVFRQYLTTPVTWHFQASLGAFFCCVTLADIKYKTHVCTTLHRTRISVHCN